MRLDKDIPIPKFVSDFFLNNPFALMYSISNRGKGKTLFMMIFAYFYSRIFPNNRINSNFSLNLPNFVYNKYSFFPYDDIFDTLILIDDCKYVKSVSKIVEITAQDSRKSNLYLILSAQYKKFVAKPLRDMAEYYLDMELDNLIVVNGKARLTKDSKLLVRFIELNGSDSLEGKEIFYWLIKNPLEIANLELYNTNERIIKPLDTNVIKAIISSSNDFQDIIINLQSYYSETKAVRLFKKMLRFSMKELKQLETIDIVGMVYNIPNKVLEKRKNDFS